MVDVSDEQFQALVDTALQELPGEHVKNIKNVAILYEEDPTPEQSPAPSKGKRKKIFGTFKKFRKG